MPIAIRPFFRVRDGQLFGRNSAVRLNFVNALPALIAGNDSIVERNRGAFAVRVADFQETLDLEVFGWPQGAKFGRQFLAFFVRCRWRLVCPQRKLDSREQRQPPNGDLACPPHFVRKASLITSEMWRAKCTLILCRTSEGTSAQSLRLGSGMM